MITRIEALNFRCLRYISRKLGPFHVLVGPNASGKTTFLDVVAFLGRLVSDGLDAAVGDTTQNFQDLVWSRKGDFFELAIEARIPEEITAKIGKRDDWDTIRYQVRIGTENPDAELSIQHERVLLGEGGVFDERLVESGYQRSSFPEEPIPPDTIQLKPFAGARNIIEKIHDGSDSFYSEVLGSTGRGSMAAFKLGPRKSALGNLPEDESKFPAATWLKKLLTDGVQSLALNSLLIRRASPPGQQRGLKPDGSNLPWVVEALKKKSPDRFALWIEHLKTALPDLENVSTVEREDDRHRYLIVRYANGVEVPSWVVSDGTLLLLALTLPAYLEDFHGVYLIEEPENGIHPRAVETMFQSLSSVYDAQILLATHSPVILSVARPKDVLCFSKTPGGATDIVSGAEHPALREWRGETNLGTLFAGGVLS